jgi:predicted RND superfamily exporter protein
MRMSMKCTMQWRIKMDILTILVMIGVIIAFIVGTAIIIEIIKSIEISDRIKNRSIDTRLKHQSKLEDYWRKHEKPSEYIKLIEKHYQPSGN